MKNISRVIIAMMLIVLAACGKTHTHEHGHEHDTGDSTNTALNEKVMALHDEVMPRMQSLYTLKKKIQDTIAHTPAMSAEKKSELQHTILALDSADAAMRDFMHTYNPNIDSTDQEKTREYIETQIERIAKIKDQTNEVIEKAKEQLK